MFLQRRFQSNEHVYINEFRKGLKDINKVHNEVNICYGSICFTALVLECFLVNVIFSILEGFCFKQFQISSLFNGLRICLLSSKISSRSCISFIRGFWFVNYMNKIMVNILFCFVKCEQDKKENIFFQDELHIYQ